MKYIDAEKLKAEIERLQGLLKSPLCECLTDDYKAGGIKQLDLLLSFITSLQEEQTEIEKEAEISPSMVSNFGPCAFNLSVTLTQEEMGKMNIVTFITKKANIIIKDAK